MANSDLSDKNLRVNRERLFWLILAGVFLWQLLYVRITPYDLAPDEAYYWTWSKRLAWGYYSKPPMVAFIIWITTALGGDTPFFVRLGAPILWALANGTFFYLARWIFGTETAFWAFLLSVATLSTPVMGLIMTIDPPLLFFWTLTMFLLWGALKGKCSFWYLGGLAFGMGLLSKYSMAVLPLGVLLYLIFTPSERYWLRRKEPYLCAIVGLLVFLPHLLWEWRHGLVAFQHTASLLKKGEGFGFGYLLEFLGGQALLVTPVTFLLFLWGLYRGAKGAIEGDPRYAYPFWPTAVIFGICVAVSLTGPCYANWGAPAYIGGLMLAAASLKEAPWPQKRKWKVLALALSVGGIMILLSYNLEPLRRLSPISQEDFPTSRVMGWRELGREVAALRESMEERPFVITPDRRIASEVAFYGGVFPRVYQYNRKLIPQSQFHLWGGLKGERGEDALLILKRGSGVPEGLSQSFESCRWVKDVVVKRKGYYIRGFSLYLCRDFRGLD